MSSYTIYPPIVDSYMPAFQVGDGNNCQIFFRLSKFNSASDVSSVHVSIVKQDTNMNVVNLKNDTANNRYRSTGIILNVPFYKVEDEENWYYIEITNNDLSSRVETEEATYEGWIPGWLYKVQMRLSSEEYDGSIEQATWLKNNASNFSEWSTICIVKATGKIDYDIPILNVDTRNENNNKEEEEIQTLYTTTLQLPGGFHRDRDLSELIHYYSFTLYDVDDNILEESGDIYANQYQDSDSFNYLLKTELEDGKTYKIGFKFTTINKLVGGFYKFNDDQDDRIYILCSTYSIDLPPCRLIMIENDANHYLTEDMTTKAKEEEEGRVALKFYSELSDKYSGNLCVRRCDSRTNFKVWTDIYLYVAKQININDIPMFYDYTIESGVWYKYGVQVISKNGERGLLAQAGHPVMRNFEYTFLLGKDNQQLKLMFDNTMNNFKYQIYDSSIDPIGSKFANITRNANTYYRTFPVNGLISFWMDENELFCNKKVIYNNQDIVDLYDEYNRDNGIIQYDYIYERDFRNKVLEFLQNGEYKLLKSPTEGNIIVRLTDVNCVPNQSLDRMVYSFSVTAREMDEPTMENYLKYGFYHVNDYATSFVVYETKLGQLQMDFVTYPSKSRTNIFKEIYNKYDSQGRNIAGYSKKVKNIHHIKITFDEKPLRVRNSATKTSGTQEGIVLGNNFLLGTKRFTVYDPLRMYEFDERLKYAPTDKLYLLGAADIEEGKKKVSSEKVHATVDFLYDIESDVYVGKQIQTRTVKQTIGQFFQECQPNFNIFRELYYKYYLEWNYDFMRLSALSSIEIEANPGAAFLVKDSTDGQGNIHVVGKTGQLRFYEIDNILNLVYLGMQDDTTGEIVEQKTDVLVNYICLVTKGTYKKET